MKKFISQVKLNEESMKKELDQKSAQVINVFNQILITVTFIFY
jgi:hypothetical protein